jgi:hypothetical protein
MELIDEKSTCSEYVGPQPSLERKLTKNFCFEEKAEAVST